MNKTSGWYETFFRGYDAALGRFMQVDPLATMAANRSTFHYAGNDPVNFNDPMGDAERPTPDDRNPVWENRGIVTMLDPYSARQNMLMNSWTNSVRGVEGNYRFMSSQQFSNYYGVDLHSDQGKAFVGQAMSSAPTEGEFQGISNSLKWGERFGVQTIPGQGGFSMEWGRLTTVDGLVAYQTLSKWFGGQQKSNVSFIYSYVYDYLQKPRIHADLGETKFGGKLSKNKSGGYDITVMVTIHLNVALKYGTQFMMNNPGLDAEVVAHELGHGQQFENFFNALNIVDLIRGADEEQVKYVFETSLGIVNTMMGASDYEGYAISVQPQFLPPGYNLMYNKPGAIKW